MWGSVGSGSNALTVRMCLHLLGLKSIIIPVEVSQSHESLFVFSAVHSHLSYETACVLGMDVVGVDEQRFGGDDVCECL